MKDVWSGELLVRDGPGSTRTHRDLLVWQEAMSLVAAVYDATSAFPREELFGLTAQLRRAAVSVPSNISEGAGRGTAKEFLHFLMIARGSLAELETLVTLAGVARLLMDEPKEALLQRVDRIGALLQGLIESVRRRGQPRRRSV